MLPQIAKQMTKAPVRPRGQHVLVPAMALVIACCVIYANRAAFTTVKAAQVTTASTASWLDCRTKVRARLEVAAANDAKLGWHSGRATTAAATAVRLKHSSMPHGGDVPSTTALLAVPTANVWAKTELLLHSLAAAHDNFELLVVDELSTDGTPQNLRKAGVRLIQPPEVKGVTFNWNLAYQVWQDTDHEALIIANNDVLLPDGVVSSLLAAMTAAGGDCDMVCPLSTVAGKGHWGEVEGIEVIFNLTAAAGAFVSKPLNYQKVQAILDSSGCQPQAFLRPITEVPGRPGFSGFFFAVRPSIEQWAYNKDNLFNPKNRIVKQEADLFKRMKKGGARMCLHAGTFIYHYKASTIPWKRGRQNFVRPDTQAAEPSAVAGGEYSKSRNKQHSSQKPKPQSKRDKTEPEAPPM